MVLWLIYHQAKVLYHYDDAFYQNIKSSTKELELLQDVRLYPTRYVNISVFERK
jgi:hypothetical protein